MNIVRLNVSGKASVGKSTIIALIVNALRGNDIEVGLVGYENEDFDVVSDNLLERTAWVRDNVIVVIESTITKEGQ